MNQQVITVVGIRNQANRGFIFKEIKDVIKNLYKIKVNYKQITLETAMENYEFRNVDLILVQNLSIDEKVCSYLHTYLIISFYLFFCILHIFVYRQVCKKFKTALQQEKFVVNEESNPNSKQLSSVCRVLSIHQNKKDQLQLQLLRWGPVSSQKMTTTVSVRKETDLDFLISVRSNLTLDHQLLVISSYPSPAGLKELISSWRREPERNKIYFVTIDSISTDGLEEKLHNIKLAYNHVSSVSFFH